LWYRISACDLDAGRALIMYNSYDIAGMQFIFDMIVSSIFTELRDDRLRKSRPTFRIILV